jgi:ATP-dependent helicase YprA (DUF1998 family)
MTGVSEASDDRGARHEHILARSLANLQAAIQLATKKKDYNSERTREKLINIFSQRFGQAPYPWQLDVTEALLLGLDTVVVAGTGAGKTMPFMMPLLLNPEKIVIILSPLKVLQRDQVCRNIIMPIYHPDEFL